MEATHELVVVVDVLKEFIHVMSPELSKIVTMQRHGSPHQAVAGSKASSKTTIPYGPSRVGRVEETI